MSFLLIVMVTVLNILSTIIQAASGFSPSIELLYSFLNFVIFVPISGYAFYKAYYGACKQDDSSIFWYRVIQSFLCISWLVFSIIKSGCFDGWLRISSLADIGNSAAHFCIFLTVMESLGYTISLLSLIHI
eukprot:TRINITY_DN2348_c0_g1_i1.p1 TRINITY_DN2348_c0_g1~~TRINITY_DN2348_c0_g1_i1.p1  ORF type:complete len:131 (+),score=5.85 TRINITY_DN2348_c0_g1_i1:218-610(+)